MGETGVAEQYRYQGYFIVEDAVEPKMLDLLENAARRVVEQVRSGAVVDAADGVRTAVYFRADCAGIWRTGIR
jgi:hypothetical protein